MADQSITASPSSSSKVQLPKKFRVLLEQPKRYKVAKGGRAGAKSWGFARALLLHGAGGTYFNRPLRILCTRETQKSIAESVHHLLRSQISLMGLDAFYQVRETSIKGINGTEFLFAGIRQQNVVNLKSFEDVDICWVEEGQVVSRRSWEILIPTIRKEGSEIWVSFNPELDSDETYQRFVVRTPPDCELITVNYYDNQFLPETIKKEIEHLKATDLDAYNHIYEGHCRQVVEGAIYKNELLAADKEQRITKVTYDATKPVHTFWDLGYTDHTSIWFAQAIGFEYRLIDFLDGSQQALPFYLQELQRRGYVYGTHYLPHDARAKQLGTGRSIEEQIRATGQKVEIVANLSLEDGIAAARSLFGKCWFDKDKCAEGLQALRHYRYPADEALSLPGKVALKRQPVHDWASHPADAFRYFAVAIKEPERQRERVRQQYTPTGENAWMA